MRAECDFIDDILDDMKYNQSVNMDARKNMTICGGSSMAPVWHSYMVSYTYGKMQFGSLVIKEEFDTHTSNAEDIAEFHNKITNEISAYQGEKIVIINIVKFN